MQILYYETNKGKAPLIDWLERLKDRKAAAKIMVRIERVKAGNLGTYRTLGEGLHELKIPYGPGYRVYFGREGNELVILLCGGDKRKQSQDIQKARLFWEDYRRAGHGNR